MATACYNNWLQESVKTSQQNTVAMDLSDALFITNLPTIGNRDCNLYHCREMGACFRRKRKHLLNNAAELSCVMINKDNFSCIPLPCTYTLPMD